MQRSDATRNRKIILAFLLIYIVLSLLLFDLRLFTGGDNVMYVILAESIVSGKGYRDIHMPEEPLHTKYPFGFPLLLSALMLVFGTNIIVFKIFVLLTGCFSIFFAYRIYEHLFGARANAVMPLYITIPLLLEYNHWILTEIPFLCLSLIAVYSIIKAEKGLKHMYYVGFVASGFFAAYAIGQFLHGQISERFNPFIYIAVGLALSGIANAFMGFLGGYLVALIVLETCDGFFQAMGWSSVVRANAELQKTEEDVSKSSTLLGTSYQFGTAITFLVSAS